jgi:ribose transport system permease protein
VIGVLIGFVILFSILRPHTFPTGENAKTLVSTQSVLAILALATMVPLIAGEFDLSVGNNLSFSAILTAKLVGDGMAIPLAIAIVLLAGVTIGIFNSILVLRINISAFIGTLGTGVLLAGFASWIAGGATVFEGIGPGFRSIGNDTLFGAIPIGGVYVLVIALVLWFLFEQTPFGRQMYATGSGREAARLAGIPTERRVFAGFVIGGLLAAAAGILYTAKLGSATPGVGDSYLLPAFAAAYLGSTTIKAGRFNPWGTLIGVLLLAVGTTGLQLMGAQNYVSDLFNGSALIIAVGVAALGAKRAARAHMA